MSNPLPISKLPVEQANLNQSKKTPVDKKIWQMFEPNYNSLVQKLSNINPKDNKSNNALVGCDDLEMELGLLATTMHTNIYYPKHNKDRITIRNPMKRRNFSNNNLPFDSDSKIEMHWRKLKEDKKQLVKAKNPLPKTDIKTEKVNNTSKSKNSSTSLKIASTPNNLLRKFNINSSNPQSPRITNNKNSETELDDLKNLLKRNKRTITSLETIIDDDIMEMVKYDSSSYKLSNIKITPFIYKRLAEFYTCVPVSLAKKNKICDPKTHKNITVLSPKQSLQTPDVDLKPTNGIGNSHSTKENNLNSKQEQTPINNKTEQKENKPYFQPLSNKAQEPSLSRETSTTPSKHNEYPPTVAIIRLGKMRYTKNGEMKKPKNSSRPAAH